VLKQRVPRKISEKTENVPFGGWLADCTEAVKQRSILRRSSTYIGGCKNNNKQNPIQPEVVSCPGRYPYEYVVSLATCEAPKEHVLNVTRAVLWINNC